MAGGDAHTCALPCCCSGLALAGRHLRGDHLCPLCHPANPALPRLHARPTPLQAINRTSEVIECQQASVPLDAILGLQSFDLEKILAMDPAFLKVAGWAAGAAPCKQQQGRGRHTLAANDLPGHASHLPPTSPAHPPHRPPHCRCRMSRCTTATSTATSTSTTTTVMTTAPSARRATT